MNESLGALSQFQCYLLKPTMFLRELYWWKKQQPRVKRTRQCKRKEKYGPPIFKGSVAKKLRKLFSCKHKLFFHQDIRVNSKGRDKLLEGNAKSFGKYSQGEKLGLNWRTSPVPEVGIFNKTCTIGFQNFHGPTGHYVLLFPTFLEFLWFFFFSCSWLIVVFWVAG